MDCSSERSVRGGSNGSSHDRLSMSITWNHTSNVCNQTFRDKKFLIYFCINQCKNKTFHYSAENFKREFQSVKISALFRNLNHRYQIFCADFLLGLGSRNKMWSNIFESSLYQASKHTIMFFSCKTTKEMAQH